MARRIGHDHGVLLGVTRTSHAITAGQSGLDPKGSFSYPEKGKRGTSCAQPWAEARLSRGRGTVQLRATRIWLVFSPHGVISSPNRLTPGTQPTEADATRCVADQRTQRCPYQ